MRVNTENKHLIFKMNKLSTQVQFLESKKELGGVKQFQI